jgi:hypothetical protein
MPNSLYTAKGQLIAELAAAGITKLSRAAIKVDKLLPELSDDDLRELYRQLTINLLATGTDEERHEMLSTMDTCPCCDRWLGHNRPPPDASDPPHRRQTSFDFDR